jgi:restriction system protein
VNIPVVLTLAHRHRSARVIAGDGGRGLILSRRNGYRRSPAERLMKWELNENSLFAILLRSAWWISIAIGVAISGVAVALLPAAWRVFGIVTGAPFLVIGVIAAWRQWRAPSAARIERTVAAVRPLSWSDFADALEDAYRRDGYTVTRISDAAADFELKKEWQTFLLCGKRWKAARTGIEPLRDLDAAREARNAHECLVVTIGEISDNARQFAAGHRIRFVDGAELARLMPALGRAG